jgi:hypothetical protein
LNHAITSYVGIIITRSSCKALKQLSKFGAKSVTALGRDGIQAEKRRHIFFPPEGEPEPTESADVVPERLPANWCYIFAPAQRKLSWRRQPLKVLKLA